MRRLAALLFALALFLLAGAAAHADTVLFGAAGVPKSLGGSRDYDRIFAALKAAKIALFLPTSIYQISPETKSLEREGDLLPPCTAASPAIAALVKADLRLVAPANLLYPANRALPPIASDPLRALIACLGRDHLFGVLAYDEPAHQKLAPDLSRRLYERVKAVDPSLPVLMVHAPLKPTLERDSTAAGRAAYLAQVLAHSRYADIVGFDLYTIPQSMARIGTPQSGDRTVDYATAARDYAAWLRQNLPGKRHLAVLQAFSYADQYAPSPWRDAEAKRLAVRPPSADELRQMARLSIDGGASVVFWWGESLLPSEDAPLWHDVLAVSKEMGSSPN